MGWAGERDTVGRREGWGVQERGEMGWAGEGDGVGRREGKWGG